MGREREGVHIPDGASKENEMRGNMRRRKGTKVRKQENVCEAPIDPITVASTGSLRMSTLTPRTSPILLYPAAPRRTTTSPRASPNPLAQPRRLLTPCRYP